MASEERWIIDECVIFELLPSHRLGNANIHSLSLFHETKIVRIHQSFAKSIFIALGKRKSDSESESIEVTSGMSTDEEEEKRKKKRKKAGKTQGQEKGKDW